MKKLIKYLLREKVVRVSLKPAVISFHGIDTKFIDKARDF